MATTTFKLPLARAQQLADAVCAELGPGCERICVAGSIRRRKDYVADIEIVAVPRPRYDLLGEPCGNSLDPLLDLLVNSGRLKRLRNGPKYKQFHLPAAGCNLDLFLATPENHGLILLIRTGPAEFSQRFVTPRSKGGLLPGNMRVEGGSLWRDGKAVVVTEEIDVFREADIPYREPWERR